MMVIGISWLKIASSSRGLHQINALLDLPVAKKDKEFIHSFTPLSSGLYQINTALDLPVA
jgi:hypothetical protein